MLFEFKKIAGFTLVAVILTGCATTPIPMTPEEFTSAMSSSTTRVDALLDKGNQEDAIKVLSDLAKHNPSRKEPWLRKAKIYFDSENYAQAIVAAEEVLQRDGTDRTAKSIRAVAGLRVASQSLNGLRDDVELKGNARADAVGLASVMRETLGEEVLVPAKKPQPAPPAPKPRPKPMSLSGGAPAGPTASPGSAPQPPAAPPRNREAASGSASGSSNPFGALR